MPDYSSYGAGDYRFACETHTCDDGSPYVSLNHLTEVVLVFFEGDHYEALGTESGETLTTSKTLRGCLGNLNDLYEGKPDGSL